MFSEKALQWSYIACAVLGFVGSITLAFLLAAFALDSPNSTETQAYTVGFVVFVIGLVMLVILPILAGWQVRYRRGILFPLIYSLLILPLFPIGTVLAIAQSVIAWKAHRQ